MTIIDILLFVALFSIDPSKVDGWRGIVPLHSTRADAERLLGPPVRPCANGCHYATESERVFVLYSGEPCTGGDHNRWRIPHDTVLSLSVYPKVKPKLPDLRLDRRKFTRTEDPELHGYSYYTNEEDGVTYSISDRRVVIGIDWFGTARDAKTLRCPTVRPPFATENAPFDRASVGVTLEEDKPRLKQFAENLKKALGTKGYVIAYGGELGPARVAKMRLKCIRDYLQKTHQIKPSRLVMLDGGYRAEISVDLFLVRVGDPIPKPAPTRYPVAVRDVPPRTNPC